MLGNLSFMDPLFLFHGMVQNKVVMHMSWFMDCVAELVSMASRLVKRSFFVGVVGPAIVMHLSWFMELLAALRFMDSWLVLRSFFRGLVAVLVFMATW